jgi:hypothetical protein
LFSLKIFLYFPFFWSGKKKCGKKQVSSPPGGREEREKRNKAAASGADGGWEKIGEIIGFGRRHVMHSQVALFALSPFS